MHVPGASLTSDTGAGSPIRLTCSSTRSRFAVASLAGTGASALLRMRTLDDMARALGGRAASRERRRRPLIVMGRRSAARSDRAARAVCHVIVRGLQGRLRAAGQERHRGSVRSGGGGSSSSSSSSLPGHGGRRAMGQTRSVYVATGAIEILGVSRVPS